MTTTTRRPRGSYAKSQARRKEIVEAAVEVFSASGYRKGSLRDVAEKVGMSQAGLLHHFPSKEHLLQAVLGWRDDDARAEIGQPFPEGLDFIRGLVALAGYNAGTPELVELHVIVTAEGTAMDHPLHDYFRDRGRWLFDLVREAFAEAEQAGELKPGVDCGDAARALIALMDGLQIQWLLDRRSVDMEGILRRTLQTLITVPL